MDVLNTILQELESAFQRHEKEVVIELAIDRMLHYIGVYLILLLVVVSKVSDLTVKNIACYPINVNSTDRGFMSYATSYCWSSTGINSTSDQPGTNSRLMHSPISVISFTQWMPYFFFAEVILFTIPSLWWHGMVGARLTGHLQFMLSFLEDVYQSVSKIPAGLYRKLPYDRKGNYLDGWRRFADEYKSQEMQGMNNDDAGYNNTSTASKGPEIHEIEPNKLELRKVLKTIVVGKIKDEEGSGRNDNVVEDSSGASALSGRMKDRHLFSMLCYENLASLDYHPYIMSVYALTSTKAAEGDRKGVGSLKQGILRQFVHKKNFNGNFLVKCYVIRYIMSIAFSLAMLIACTIIFGSVLVETFGTKTFICDIPFHKKLVCTMKGHWDVTAHFVINFCILLVYLALSVFQFHFVRFGSHRALCHYFEDMGDNFSVALTSAYKAEQNMKSS